MSLLPPPCRKATSFYAKLSINGIELGDRTPNGAWLGVPVDHSRGLHPGDIDNNLGISRAMRDAVVEAIKGNADISAGTYIRETGSRRSVL